MSFFLNFETESIAVQYERLYQDLVSRVRDCVAQDRSLYLGGVRRVQRSSLPGELCRTLEDQNARAYAKRCLQISRNSIRDVSNDLAPWSRVLQRARERVQISEAIDRRRIRAVIVQSLKTVMGIDPLKEGAALSPDQYSVGIRDHWPELQYVLERELDTELPFDHESLRKPLIASGLEAFVSQIQRQMELPGQSGSVTVVVPVNGEHKNAYSELRKTYETVRGPRAVRNIAKGARSFVVLNLGD